jgi:Spy/CpxP family protein refolding chaperone
MSVPFVRALALCALAAGLPLAASAQVVPPQGNGPAAPPAQGAPHRHPNPYMRALRSLDLTDAQRSRIRSIVQTYRQKDQGTAVDQTTRRANMQQMRADILNVLTPVQRTQLQQQIQQMRQQPNPAPGT